MSRRMRLLLTLCNSPLPGAAQVLVLDDFTDVARLRGLRHRSGSLARVPARLLPGCSIASHVQFGDQQGSKTGDRSQGGARVAVQIRPAALIESDRPTDWTIITA